MDKPLPKFKGADSKNLNREEVTKFLSDAIDLELYKKIELKEGNVNQRRYEVYKCTSNKTFWQDIILGNTYVGKRVLLSSFDLLEWIPYSPGLFFTTKAIEQRKKALKYYNRRDGEYLPMGKQSMVMGGVGSVRLSSFETKFGFKYLLGATSNGVCHEGIPVIVNQKTYNRVIDSIKETGSCNCIIEGTIQILPVKKSLIQHDLSIPKICIYADRIRLPFKQSSNIPDITAYLCYSPLNGYEESELEKKWTFCSFYPDKQDEDLKSSVDWMLNYIDRHSINDGNNIILSEFDEHKKHFENPIEFPLNQIMKGQIDENLLFDYARRYHLTILKDGQLVSNHQEILEIRVKGEEQLEVKKLLSESKVEDAINKLLEIFQHNREKANELIILSSRLNTNNKKERLSLASNEEISIERNKIVNSLLYIIDDN